MAAVTWKVYQILVFLSDLVCLLILLFSKVNLRQLNSNKYELDRLENNIEFQLDNQNLYEIGEFTNTNYNVIYIYDFSTHFKFIIHNGTPFFLTSTTQLYEKSGNFIKKDDNVIICMCNPPFFKDLTE